MTPRLAQINACFSRACTFPSCAEFFLQKGMHLHAAFVGTGIKLPNAGGIIIAIKSTIEIKQWKPRMVESLFSSAFSVTRSRYASLSNNDNNGAMLSVRNIWFQNGVGVLCKASVIKVGGFVYVSVKLIRLMGVKFTDLCADI